MFRDIDVKLSKAERRKQFALRVQQEEEEERLRRAAEEQEAEEQRRVEAEMWRQHEEQCRALGLDPVMTAALYQQQRMQDPMLPPQYYDPVSNQWLPYTGQSALANPSRRISKSFTQATLLRIKS